MIRNYLLMEMQYHLMRYKRKVKYIQHLTIALILIHMINLDR
jgi:hypothetical protein